MCACHVATMPRCAPFLPLLSPLQARQSHVQSNFKEPNEAHGLSGLWQEAGGWRLEAGKRMHWQPLNGRPISRYNIAASPHPLPTRNASLSPCSSHFAWQPQMVPGAVMWLQHEIA